LDEPCSNYLKLLYLCI